MKKFFYIAIMIAAVFAGCSNQGNEQNAAEEARAKSKAKLEDRLTSPEAQFEARLQELKKLGKRRGVNKDSLQAVYDAYLQEQAMAHIGEDLGLKITHSLAVNFNYKQLDSVMNLCEVYKQDPELNRLYEAALNAEATGVGKRYVDFEAEERRGDKMTRLSKLMAKGKPIVLTFWTSSSIPCRNEIREFIQPIVQDYRKDVLFVCTAVMEDTIYDAQRAASELEIIWPMLYAGDKNNPPTKPYGVLHLPHTLIIGKDGIIKARGLRGAQIEEAIKKEIGRK
jgi:ribosome assembly protein YihI (activator of Der GTPase)